MTTRFSRTFVALVCMAAVLFTIAPVSARKPKILNDDNFEHDTQATTGATTGDWFVLFCDPHRNRRCRDEINELWEELAGELFGKVTVAYIDV